MRKCAHGRITRLTVEASGASAAVALPFRAAGLSRQCLDEALMAAAHRAGAEVLRGTGVTALLPHASGVEVRAGGRAYKARTAVLATGKHDIRGWRRPIGALSAFKQQYALGPRAIRRLEDRVHLVLYEGGYLGACLVEGSLATLCWLAEEALMQRTHGRWAAQLGEIAGCSPQLAALLKGARPLFDKPAAVCALPFGWRRRAVIHDAVYPVGDQLAVIPSFAGDGTALALASGVGAASAVLGGRSAGEFQRTFIARTSAQFRWAGVLDWCLRRQITQRLAVRALALVPQLGPPLADMTRATGACSPQPSVARVAP